MNAHLATSDTKQQAHRLVAPPRHLPAPSFIKETNLRNLRNLRTNPIAPPQLAKNDHSTLGGVYKHPQKSFPDDGEPPVSFHTTLPDDGEPPVSVHTTLPDDGEPPVSIHTTLPDDGEPPVNLPATLPDDGEPRPSIHFPSNKQKQT